MFSFFRRSKKESDSNNGSSSKDKKNKEASGKERVSPTLNNRDSCKNNIQTSHKPEIALERSNVTSLPNSSQEFGLRENESNATKSSDVTSLLEKNESTPTNKNYEIMSEDNSANVINSTISYANMLKKPEPVREVRTSSVKPCGHGTTGVAPRVPIVTNKKENNTPPSSPVLELKNHFKRAVNETKDTSSIVYEKPTLNKNTGPIQDTKDTVTASLKLHLNFPTPPSSNNSPTEETLIKSNDTENEQKNLINQEAKFQTQLNDLSKQLAVRDAEANKLRFQMEELQRDVFAKSAGMDRLQAELNAAHKETEAIRQRIRNLENELATFREKNSELSEELTDKTETHSEYVDETTAKIAELEDVIKKLQLKIENLEEQLAKLQQEKEHLEEKRAELIAERESERQKVVETIEQAAIQKQEIEKKWKEDFEKLRTINILKEQQLLDDFEWKLREVQQTCKKRLEDKDKVIEERIQEAYKTAETKMKEAETMMAQAENLKSYELEVEKLRGLTIDQDKAIKEMINQHDQMKIAEDSLKNEAKRLRNLIEIEKENIQHIQRLHHQEIVDKERTLQQTLRQKRIEIAMYWEERLLHECGRLKSELEQIHNEEKHFAMETVRRDKDEEFQKIRKEWEDKLRECLKEITHLKRALDEKDEYYQDEIVRSQSKTDQDLIELRRLMDKIDMSHHDKYEKVVHEHELEIEKINQENENKLKEVETIWQNQVSSLRTTLELVKEQMEQESQQKIESLIQQHRDELDTQWDNLIHQKSEAIKLVEDEYVSKYKTLEEQFYTQQKSHTAREIELLKTIDTLKNELESKESTIDDLQNNVDTLEGGIQVLNGEIAQQGELIIRCRREADQKVKGLQEAMAKLQESHDDESEAFRLKYLNTQKQSNETIDHLQRKCQCLTKLFEEVRLRYERRESRQEDLNVISDLRQVIAEQEKDLACINEEKRYFQMRLMALENRLEENVSGEEEDTFEDAQTSGKIQPYIVEEPPDYPALPSSASENFTVQMNGNNMFLIPPTIPECDDCDDE